MIGTVTARGLHELVASHVLSGYPRPGARAVEIGADPEAMCERLSSLGCQILAIDRDQAVFEGKNRVVVQDMLNVYRRKDQELQVLRPPLFRLSKLAHADQLAHVAQMTTALATQSRQPGTH